MLYPQRVSSDTIGVSWEFSTGPSASAPVVMKTAFPVGTTVLGGTSTPIE